MMNLKPIVPLVLSCFLLFSSTATAFNITNLLGRFPEFSGFNQLLNQTHLNEEINRRATITVLAVSDVSAISGKSADVIKRVLSNHVVLDYYDVPKLQKLKWKTSVLTTLFQSSGVANGQQGFLNVTDLASGDIVFGSNVRGAPVDAKLLRLVAAQPYNISVLEISHIIYAPGIDGNFSAPPPPPTRAPAPAPHKPRSPKKSPAPSPDVVEAPSPVVADTPLEAPAEVPTADSPTSSPPEPEAPTADSSDKAAAPAPSKSSGSRAAFPLSLGVAMGLASAWVVALFDPSTRTGAIACCRINPSVAKMMSLKPIVPLVLSCFLLFSSAATAFNITNLLGRFPEFSGFNQLLNQTHLNEEINRRATITVLAVSDVSAISGKSADVIKRVLSNHVVLDYYDVPKLQKLKGKTSVLTTLFQSSGVANGQQGFLNVTDLASGDIVFGSNVKGAPVDAKLLRLVAAQPYNISVLEISHIIYAPGIDGNFSAPPPPPTRAPAPAPHKPRSPKKSPAPSPDVVEAPSPVVADPPLEAPAEVPTADSPTSSPPEPEAPTADSSDKAAAPTPSKSSGSRAAFPLSLGVAMGLASAWVVAL
ncbi:hypothetical protein F0562_007627 [Nyssa sinensis]|uniref:FAS1 domain-containing protein n=1 Tax=Nyssa sinensis TaxID=561372 RepID=A0A5J5A7C8_9ASTE|nr:hypothetical protein F0562_007627 [Nyssa sinensis]